MQALCICLPNPSKRKNRKGKWSFEVLAPNLQKVGSEVMWHAFKSSIFATAQTTRVLLSKHLRTRLNPATDEVRVENQAEILTESQCRSFQLIQLQFKVQYIPSFPSSSPSPLFHFLALVSFLARSKPKVPFLGISLLRDQTETLATQAKCNLKDTLRKIK